MWTSSASTQHSVTVSGKSDNGSCNPSTKKPSSPRGHEAGCCCRQCSKLAVILASLHLHACKCKRSRSQPGADSEFCGGSQCMGATRIRFSESTDSWESTSKLRMVSTSSPKNSRRQGCRSPGENTSRMPPRMANSPCPSTMEVRRNPRPTRAVANSGNGMRSPI